MTLFEFHMTNSLLYNLLFPFCFLATVVLHGQPIYYSFQKMGIEEGLPNNRSYGILEDREGIIWMSTFDGLIRYDGQTYKSYRHRINDSLSISGNAVRLVHEAADGRLWIGTNLYGLNIFDKATENFTRIIPDSTNTSSLQSDNIYSICEDKAKRIWIAGNKGLEILSYKSNEVRLIPLKELFESASFPSDLRATTLLTDSKNRVWIGSTSGIHLYYPDEQKLISPKSNPDFIRHYIQDIEEDFEGNIWIACKNKGPRMYRFEASTKQFIPFEGIPFRSKNLSLQFCFDTDQHIWASEHGKGVYLYDLPNATLLIDKSQNTNFSFEQFVRNPMLDGSGNIWMSGEGFIKYNYPKGFKTYQHPYDFHQSSSCIYDDGEFFWLGYREQGLIRLSHKDNSKVLYTMDAAPGYALHTNLITEVLRLSKNKVLIIPFGAIQVLDLPTGKIKTYPLSGTNRSLYKDSKGRIWVGGYSGLYLFSEEKGIIKKYTFPQRPASRAVFVQGIVEDKAGNLWIGTGAKGLTKFNPETEEMTPFLPNNKNTNSLPTWNVVDLKFDHKGILWLATEIGLVKFEEDTNNFTIYNNQHGLTNDYINTLICTKDQGIWVSTNNSIAQFDEEQEHFTLYDKGDGLINPSYYPRNSIQREDGTLYFGSRYGIDFFNPAELRKNPFPPKLILSRFYVNNKTFDLTDLKKEKTISLSYKENFIEIEWAGLHYTRPDRIKYYYKIQGFNEEWISSGQERKIMLANLAPGNYQVEAKACNIDDLCSAQNLLLSITIQPPFWQRWWFKLLLLLTTIAGILVFIKRREKLLQAKQEEKAKIKHHIADLEKRALLAQMNPHFIFNAMNSIQQFISIKDTEGAMNYLSRFSRLIRVVLNFSSQNKVALAEEIAFIKDYLELEQMRFPNKFNYDIQIAGDVNVHTIDIPPFFIQPQVENAIKHGLLNKKDKGHIKIEISKISEHLSIIIEDNGIGREAAQKMNLQSAFKYTGKGLSISKERLQLMQDSPDQESFQIIDLFDEYNRPKGTRICLTLPID